MTYIAMAGLIIISGLIYFLSTRKTELGNRDNTRDKYILMFNLTDKEGKELDYIRTGASDVQKWAVTWYNEKIVILNSSDIGTYSWTIGKDGKLISILVTDDMMKKGDEAYEKKYGRPRR